MLLGHTSLGGLLNFGNEGQTLPIGSLSPLASLLPGWGEGLVFVPGLLCEQPPPLGHCQGQNKVFLLFHL